MCAEGLKKGFKQLYSPLSPDWCWKAEHSLLDYCLPHHCYKQLRAVYSCLLHPLETGHWWSNGSCRWQKHTGFVFGVELCPLICVHIRGSSHTSFVLANKTDFFKKNFDSRSMTRRQRFLYDTPFPACIIVSVLNADKMRGFFFGFFLGCRLGWQEEKERGEGEEK